MLNKQVLIACYSESSRERLKTILLEYGMSSVFVKNFADFKKLGKNQIGLASIIIKNGFETSDLIVITEQDLFGEKIIKTSNDSGKTLEKILREQSNLNIGDLVIHKDYGLGRFTGLDTIGLSDVKNDYLRIEYANKTNLFIPIEDFDLITRYGDYNEDVELDRLGSERWIIKRNKVKELLMHTEK